MTLPRKLNWCLITRIQILWTLKKIVWDFYNSWVLRLFKNLQNLTAWSTISSMQRIKHWNAAAVQTARNTVHRRSSTECHGRRWPDQQAVICGQQDAAHWWGHRQLVLPCWSVCIQAWYVHGCENCRHQPQQPITCNTVITYMFK